MRLNKPRSLSGLMLLGFFLVAVPLLIAIVNAAFQIRRMASQSETLVVQGVQVTRYNQLLLEQIASLERAARLYEIIGNRELLDVYRQNHARFNDTLDALSRFAGQLKHPQDSETKLALLRNESLHLLQMQQVKTPSIAASRESPATDFSVLWEGATALAEINRRQIDAQLDSLQKAMNGAQRTLFWQSAALLPWTLILAFGFTLLLVRPLRTLDRVIGELGRGTFSRAIKVEGPKDLEQLGGQLEWLRMRLLELAQEKNRFLRHMSHELKTPLANIREGTELLMDGSVGPLAEDQREVATILRENGIKLQRLIENLLSFSAWQAQSVGLELSEFKLRPLIKGVLESQQLTLVSQRVQLDIRIEEVTVTADRAKVRLIVDNLLSNAIKFTPRNGSIAIHAALIGRQLVLDVADSGPGIPLTERTRIFEAFYQGKAQQGGHVKGTGIGLSVVIEFVHAHGGTIDIVDGEYSGAHFRVRLPVKQLAKDAGEPAHAA
jgi:two-component system, NtrC family, sensor histidine kinase GlrK